MSDAPTSYGELADIIDNLGLIVREARRARGTSQRAAAAQMGGQYSTISRVENGAACDSTSLLLILRWLDLTAPPAAPVAAPAAETNPLAAATDTGDGPCAGCGHQPGEHPIHCDGWLDTAPAEFPGGLAVQAAAKPATNSVCGARGICISPTPSGDVPVCGKPAGHVEAGDRWHTPDTDDWGSDMRWAVRG